MESEKLSQDESNSNQNDISNDKLKSIKSMEAKEISQDKNENNLSKANFINIKSKYILSKIYDNLGKKKKLNIVKYNKKLQNRLNLNIKDYEQYCEIEIEIIPCDGKYGNIFNINEKNKIYYHIYFNDNKEEIKNKYNIRKKDKVNKVKIIIDYQVMSFKNLFKNCLFINSITFKKFSRINITDMSFMFYKCLALKELNLSNFNTNNVTNMSYMFWGCESLEELNLSNFNTNNVVDMRAMFYECYSLKELNLSNFNVNNVTEMRGMFSGCTEQFQNKIKAKYKNIKEEAFHQLY